MSLFASAARKSVVGSSLTSKGSEISIQVHAGLSVLRWPANDRCGLRGNKARRLGQHSDKARWAVRPAAASGRVC